MQVIPRRGTLVAGADSAPVRAILDKAHCRVETFGLDEGADWRAGRIAPGERGWTFHILKGGTDLGEFRLNLPGEHNIRNAVAAVAAASAAGVVPERAREILSTFRGVKRRLEVRGEERGVVVYDDFAHHPTAVRETLQALRSLPARGRLVAVFEPRSYTSRTRVFQEDFARSFVGADRVVIAAAHLPGKVPEGERISEKDLVDRMVGLGLDARFIASVDAIVDALTGELREGDRVVVLSNGGFGGIHGKLLQALSRPRATAS
jgi:UDP-N-acetylmuramate: L-alanyl-gamma-D-glutamyl-meso-diaminopimelate ligase